MSIIIHIVVSCLMVELVKSVYIPLEHQKVDHDEQSLRSVLESLANFKTYLTSGNSGRRAINMAKLERARNKFNAFSKKMGSANFKKRLRALAPAKGEVQRQGNNDYESLVEKELEHTDTQHSSLILDKAVVEKNGQNDFLVMKPIIDDPFATVIPNNIYYNIEKKCVNWLDDCSLQGIRARLLEKVQSPYKK